MASGISRALLGPADKRARRPTRATCSKPTRKSPTGQETNRSAAFLSLCDPTFITGEGGDRASAENLIQIIRPRHRVHQKAVSYQAWEPDRCQAIACLSSMTFPKREAFPLLSARSNCSQSGKSGRSGEETLREARRYLQLEHSCGQDRAGVIDLPAKPDDARSRAVGDRKRV